MGELLEAAEEQHEIAERKAAEAEARRRREAVAARERYLDGLVGREDSLWNEADRIVAEKEAGSYGRAAERIVDLRDLSVRQGTESAFAARLGALRAKHARKWSFIRLLNQALGRE